MAENRVSAQALSAHELDALEARTTRLLEGITEQPRGGTRPSFLRRRLSAEIERRGLASLRDLLAQAERGQTTALVELRNRMAVNYSCFWREPAHWSILTEHLRPKFLAGAPVRLWSAACASGEEACSMAMAVGELVETLTIPPKTGDWRILASDIATAALAAAAIGHYPDTALGALSEANGPYVRLFQTISQNARLDMSPPKTARGLAEKGLKKIEDDGHEKYSDQ